MKAITLVNGGSKENEMRKFLSTALAGVMLATSAIAIAPAAEARGWHNGGGYHSGYYGDRGYRHHGSNAGAAIAGLALGAIIGGAIVSNHSSYYDNGYYGNRGYGYGYRDSYRRAYYDDGHNARCFRQYGRSFDPSSNTFVGRDGGLYYCGL